GARAPDSRAAPPPPPAGAVPCAMTGAAVGRAGVPLKAAGTRWPRKSVISSSSVGVVATFSGSATHLPPAHHLDPNPLLGEPPDPGDVLPGVGAADRRPATGLQAKLPLSPPPELRDAPIVTELPSGRRAERQSASAEFAVKPHS